MLIELVKTAQNRLCYIAEESSRRLSAFVWWRRHALKIWATYASVKLMKLF